LSESSGLRRHPAMATCNAYTLCGNVASVPALPQISQNQASSSFRRMALKAGRLSQSFTLQNGSSLHKVVRQEVEGVRQGLVGQAVAEVQFVNPQDAKKLVDETGYTIVDIRDQVQYERAHIPTAVHVPYYIRNDDMDIGTIIKRQAHNNFAGLFYGLAFTKENPNFNSTITEKFPKDSKLLLVCNEGLRSGYASDRLEDLGYENVAYIARGLQIVEPGIFPKEGKVELKDAGKGGVVEIQGKISVVLGTVLVLAFLFLQFFPDQANELFFKS
jgi:rhodanese-related sulfurtransferase